MRYYETLYLINPNLANDDYKEVVTKFNDLIEAKKGVVTKTDEWGKKSLAYPVKKFDKGFYVLLQYCGEAAIADDLQRGLRLDDRVLKFQTIKLGNDVDPEELKPNVEESKKEAGEDTDTKETTTDKEDANGVS